jgi:hypothetical protein
MSGVIREQPGYIRNFAGNVWDDSAFDPGWNKILNITGVVCDDSGSIALPASSLALPGTLGVTSGSTIALPAQTRNDPGYYSR